MMTSTEAGASRPPGGAPAIRLYVSAPLRAGAELVLAADQAHYLSHVMRRVVDDRIALFNGADGEWRARIARVAKHAVTVAVETLSRAQAPEPDLWLVFAPIKRARLDFLAEKATELGVAELHPVLTRRTVVERVKLERLVANAREAAEQTGRLSVPMVHAPRALSDVIAAWPADRRLVVCDETGGGTPIVAALQGLKREPGHWAVAVGPEGGFEPAELAALRALPNAVPVGLGPRLLRADTAALAALACWQAVLGDWHRAPRAA